MVAINYATREVSCKIVFYGPGLSGKTTNLQYVHDKIPSDTKGKLISLATDADRTLYFDFLPINIGTINGFAAKFQLYTVPGQVYYNATRKLVLRGVDGLVFVADSQPDKMDENIESINNLRENLAEYGYGLDELPIVIQYNKQDLPGVLSVEVMSRALNPDGWPEFSASATEGFGVFDTLKCILKLVLDKAKSSGAGTSSRPDAGGQAPSPPVAAPDRVEAPGQQPAAPPPPSIKAPQQQEVSTPPSQPQPVEQVQDQPSYKAVAEHKSATIEKPPPPASPTAQPEAQSELQREQVQEPTQPSAEIRSAYRPFPGNTMEDEERMIQLKQQQVPLDGGTSKDLDSSAAQKQKPLSSTDLAGGVNGSEPSAMPRMAPSLKAEKQRPKKKRSFFKRLFGLK
jgi:signal recognition particle receptor subunit beta